MSNSTVLSIENLSVTFPIYRGAVKALNGVSLTVNAGEIVGVVGESGSGKSVTAMMVMRLIAKGSYTVTQGRITALGQAILTLEEKALRQLRGADMAMIFQEPMTALNPTKRIGQAMSEVIRRHQSLSKSAALALAEDLLRDMVIADPAATLKRYPFELSGGMRQRILIALAFACRPKLLIADEPTTALDVTVQKQVLTLLKNRAQANHTGVLFISHDMAVVSQLCDRVYVMYAGSVVESGPSAQVLQTPKHPYTQGLLHALPDRVPAKAPLQAIPGTVPDLAQLPTGCAFRARCQQAHDACLNTPTLNHSGQHAVACWLAPATESLHV